MVRFPGTNTRTLSCYVVFFLLTKTSQELESFFSFWCWEPSKAFLGLMRWADDNMGGPAEIEEDVALSQLIIEKTEALRIHVLDDDDDEDDDEDDSGNVLGQPS